MAAPQTTPELATAAAAPDPGQDAWAVAWRQLRRNRLAMGALWAIFLLFGVACSAPLLANGRPLYLRAHVTSVYENDVAAFEDWHRRLGETTVLLGGEVSSTAREALLERRALYVAGLPGILERIEGALDETQRAAFAPLRREYVARLVAERLDLDALERARAQLDGVAGALSIGAAYKKAAGPLLGADDWVEAVSDARATGADLATLKAQGEELAARVDLGVAHLLSFLPEADRAGPADATAKGCAALRAADAPTWSPAAAREALRALEAALDHAAGARVPQALQRLPQVTQWPAFRYLTPAEVGFMVLYLACVAALVLRAPFLALSGRGRAAAILGPAVAAALLWHQLVPAGLAPADSVYKELARAQKADPEADGTLLFPLVPFGENENIYVDRTTPPVLFELVGADDGDAAQGLARRMREPDEARLEPADARLRLDRLRSHWVGTDDNGRDVLARLIIGSRVSLSVGFVAVSIYVAIGIVLGAVAGYFKGWVDIALSRFNEIVTCFPAFFLIISVMSIFDRPTIFHVMVVIGLTRWTEVFRLVRAEFLRLGSLDFVTAGKALGLTNARIVFRHILPNALGPVFVAAAFGVAGAILVESALSFLGFGVPPPQASWGSVLHDARGHEQQMWWITIFPGLLIFITITAYNLVGEGLRDALDPRLRR